jgi:hypothetical protein
MAERGGSRPVLVTKKQPRNLAAPWRELLQKRFGSKKQIFA